MFSFYGSKSKIVDYYPPPKYKKIIEPFAGSARYSLKYFEHDITLIEKFDKVFKIWEYLQKASKEDILSLPSIKEGESLNDFKLLSDVEKWLIGYHLRRGCARPSLSSGDRCSWDKDKIRIANDLYKIKHWKIIYGDFFEQQIIENTTYFIDPPYSVQIHKYNHHKIDYIKLANIINNIKGQVIVCGNSDDKWLDFKPLKKMAGNCKSHMECMWTNENMNYAVQMSLF
jgi:site-specific DNA-adenine methylase